MHCLTVTICYVTLKICCRSKLQLGNNWKAIHTWTGTDIHTIMSSNLQAWWVLIWNVVVISATVWGCDNLSRYFYVYNVALLPKFQCNKPVLSSVNPTLMLLRVDAFEQQRKKDKICGLPPALWSNEADRQRVASNLSFASVFSLHLCTFGYAVLLVVHW